MTDSTPKDYVHITSATKREGLPEVGQEQKCDRKECPGPDGFKNGFGLAAGGYGIYRFCEICKRVVSKTLVEEW